VEWVPAPSVVSPHSQLPRPSIPPQSCPEGSGTLQPRLPTLATRLHRVATSAHPDQDRRAVDGSVRAPAAFGGSRSARGSWPRSDIWARDRRASSARHRDGEDVGPALAARDRQLAAVVLGEGRDVVAGRRDQDRPIGLALRILTAKPVELGTKGERLGYRLPSASPARFSASSRCASRFRVRDSTRSYAPTPCRRNGRANKLPSGRCDRLTSPARRR
jgi:hypothetical protein